MIWLSNVAKRAIFHVFNQDAESVDKKRLAAMLADEDRAVQLFGKKAYLELHDWVRTGKDITDTKREPVKDSRPSQEHGGAIEEPPSIPTQAEAGNEKKKKGSKQ